MLSPKMVFKICACTYTCLKRVNFTWKTLGGNRYASEGLHTMRSSSETTRAPGMPSSYIEWLKGTYLLVRAWQKRGPLEKRMANYFSMLSLRTPWIVWKGKKIWHWKMTPKVNRCPIYYWRRVEKQRHLGRPQIVSLWYFFFFFFFHF